MLFISLTSVSFAYTIDDFINYAKILRNMNISTQYNNVTNAIINHASSIKNKINWTNVKTICIKNRYDDNSLKDYMRIFYSTNSNVTINNVTHSTNSDNISFSQNLTWYRLDFNISNGQLDIVSGSFNQSSFIGNPTYCVFGLIDCDDTYVNWPNNIYFNNRYAWVNGIEYTTQDNPLPLLIGHAFSGKSYAGNSFSIYDTNGTEILCELIIEDYTDNRGALFDIYLKSPGNIINGDAYYLSINYNNSPIARSEIFTLNFDNTNFDYIPPGTITNPSR